jgi:TonB-linked SusC/RagA family outer membrane protein
MKLKLNGFLVLLLALITQISFAQERAVSGVVSDNAGMPLPGVSVLVKGDKTGTQTGFDGAYTIKAKPSDILVFSYIGMKTQERGATSTSIFVKLMDNAQQLTEVIVTSQGIRREKKKVGYAISEVKAKDLEQRADGDIARVLSGKASGVNIISQSGLSGSGTNVIIRGLSSFSSSNQALFIVDGVPFSSDTNSAGRQGDRNDFVNGNNGSSRFLDLDPNNIENVSILKGLAAATLYGSEGRNGVVLITTKTGTKKKGKGSDIAIATSLFINEIASLPDYQNKYGGGFDQSFGWFFSNWGPTFEKTGAAGWGNSAAFDANGTLAHPYSTSNFAAAFPEYAGKRYEYKPYNSVKDFFRKGVITNTSVNFAGQSNDGNFSYNVNYGHNDDQGFTPGNDLVRNTLSIGGRGKFSNKFTVGGTLNYAKTDFKSPPVALSQGNGATGTGSSLFGDLWFTPRSVDMLNLPYQNPLTGGSVYYRQNNSIQHPLWTLNNSGTTQITNRVFGNASVTYDFNNHLNLQYRVGLDNYVEANVNFQNRGGVNGNSGDARTASGFYESWDNAKTIWDHNLALNGNYKLSDKFDLNFNIGATSKNETLSRTGVASDGQQIFGVLRHYNFSKSTPIEDYSNRNIAGVYAQTEIDYNNYLYLTLAGRKDWVSNFAKENNSQFYPSASIAFIPTTAFDQIYSEKLLSYLKLRAGVGSSANFGNFGRYPVSNTLDLNVRDNQDGAGQNIITNAAGQTLGNPDLKPELMKEFEVGIETKFYHNRFGFDLSLFKRITNNLIISRPLDPSTGYSTTLTNIGEIEAKGLELDVMASIIKNEKDGFNWDTSINITSNKSIVTDLGLNTERVVYSGFSNLGNVAQVGESLSSIYGSKILRDANGKYVVNENGFYIQDTKNGIIGDANPDWVMNVNNTISYKNFNFGFLINYTKGGDIYSSTISTLLGRGLINETLDRERSFILPGVNNAGQPNNVQIVNNEFYFNNVLFGPNEMQVYDATTIRLQELSLGYSIPAKFLDRTAFSSVSFKLSGSNLYYRAINTPKGANFDPNTSGTGIGNGVGFDFLNGPSSRKFGLSVKATF